MTTQFIVTSDISPISFVDYQKSVNEIKTALEQNKNKQNDIIGRVSARMLPDPQGYKNDIEECKRTLRVCRKKLKRLSTEQLPHLKEIGKMAEGFQLLQTLRVDYLECENKNAQLLLLKDSDHFKRAYLLSKGTMKKVENVQATKDSDTKIKEIFSEIGPLISSRHAEIQTLDTYLISQIHSCHIELLSFIAEKLADKREILTLINTIQTNPQNQINPLPSPYTTQFPHEIIPLPAYLRFQNSSGFTHWCKQHLVYSAIQSQISELETIAQDLWIIQTKLRKKMIDFLSPPIDSTANQLLNNTEVQIQLYDSYITTIKSHIQRINTLLSSMNTSSSGHYGVYYGSRLLEFVEEVRWYFDKYALLARCVSRILTIPKDLFAQLSLLANPQIHLPANAYTKLTSVHSMVNLFHTVTDPKATTFVDKQLHKIFVVCHQIVATVGSDTLKTIDSSDCYDTLVKRQSFEIATKHVQAGKEVLMRRHFSTKPQWQLNVLLYNIHLKPDTALLSGPISTMLAHNFSVDAKQHYKIFSTFFFELSQYHWDPSSRMHYLNLYSKYKIILEEYLSAKKCDKELCDAVSSKLHALQTTYEFPQLSPKPSDTEPDDDAISSDEERSFNMYARGLWGTTQDFDETLVKLAHDELKESALKYFFILKAFKIKQLDYPAKYLPKVLQAYLNDDAITLGFQRNFGVIFCESVMYQCINDNTIKSNIVQTRRGQPGYSIWQSAMQILLSTSELLEKKQFIQNLQPGETQYTPIISAIVEELRQALERKQTKT